MTRGTPAGPISSWPKVAEAFRRVREHKQFPLGYISVCLCGMMEVLVVVMALKRNLTGCQIDVYAGDVKRQNPANSSYISAIIG